MNKKLYILLSNTNLYSHFSQKNNSIMFINAPYIPFIYYPKFTPCFEANSYMIYLFKKNLSTFNGGTLLTYCIRISLLVRFISDHKNISNFSDLTDDHIYEFISFLKLRKITDSHIINIFKQSVDFLFFIADLYNLKYFIGFSSEFQIKLRRNSLNPSYYTHLSLPPTSPKNIINPISLVDIKKIRLFVSEIEDQALKFRNLCILDLLEFTGARRSEILNLRVENINNANLNSMNGNLPLLEILILKRRVGSNIRKIPIPQNLLNNLMRYIRQYRTKIMRKNLMQKHDFLFISHKNGDPLKSDTLTTYLNIWSKNSNIFPAIHAHQFRHRFITEKFKDLILQHKINNVDEFSKMLLSHEKIKQQVLQWTGHTNSSSLDVYIHIAISELTNLTDSIDQVQKNNSINYLKSNINDLINDFNNSKISENDFLEKIKYLVNE
ncbi:tyrosine-type recombinase/integrase [Acinetobacter baumannii]|uniref:tyrosine-type recombinase/integrase n=1 Tax=Acinetobacter pittii TaxID=48296 RepID=UPI001981C913|nr:tyrosine-type recombinase/integrase [Acinetobacter pittii]MBN6522088.1 tyrosine-type recombinase/integrase [Acinetobacter pittii]MDA4917000.1 tyrosine-type recombinase/integrase [Acinetobacter baumannii]